MDENSKIETVDPLLRFCGEANERYRLGEPFVVRGHRYYTDGRIAVRVMDNRPDTEQWEGGARFPRSIADFPWWEKPSEDGAAVSLVTNNDSSGYCGVCRGAGKGHFRVCPDCGGEERVVLVSPSGTRYKRGCGFCNSGISLDGTDIVTCPQCEGFRYARYASTKLRGHEFSMGLVAAIAHRPDHVNGWMLDDQHNLYRLVGKKAAGRLLDGREWNEVPEGMT